MADIAESQIGSPRSRDDDQIPVIVEAMASHAEPLPNETLDPIPLRSPTDLLGDDEAETTVRLDPTRPGDQEVPSAEDPRSTPMLRVLPRCADA